MHNLNLAVSQSDRKLSHGFRSGFRQLMYQIPHGTTFECVINLIECKQARMRRGAAR